MSDAHAEELVLPGMILPPPAGIGVATPPSKAIVKPPLAPARVLDLPSLEIEQPRRLADLEHPVTAYLNGLAPSSRRPQLAALEAIARRSTQVFSAETMPWARLRRPHVLKIRSVLEENLTATSNRMLSALRGVLKEWEVPMAEPPKTDGYPGWSASWRVRSTRPPALRRASQRSS